MANSLLLRKYLSSGNWYTPVEYPQIFHLFWDLMAMLPFGEALLTHCVCLKKSAIAFCFRLKKDGAQPRVTASNLRDWTVADGHCPPLRGVVCRRWTRGCAKAHCCCPPCRRGRASDGWRSPFLSLCFSYLSSRRRSEVYNCPGRLLSSPDFRSFFSSMT